MNSVAFNEFAANCRSRVETALAESLAQPTLTSDLVAAMRYATLNGGKRIRPLLAYATAEAIADIDTNTDHVAVAVELCHAYSLVHDDLPAMDDDDLRRGKPTCHRAYNEAIAILAGDALQTLAFEQLSRIQAKRGDTIAVLLRTFARAAGATGMVGGQAFDIASVGKPLSLKQLELMHQGKTGALINASIVMAALATEQANADQLQALRAYGSALGLAFQVKDDILDVESDTQTLGKTQGSDSDRNKPTYTSILGLNAARDKLQILHEQAIEALQGFGPSAVFLRQLADYIVERRY